ncbi:MAG: TrkA family potassium uptake protein [Thermoleophilia bacterium]|nr:TrkA family potassium uptake protein [Thermoleophilia bacterium]
MSRHKKQVCIIGLGHFGWELALTLAGACEVLAIDRNEALVNEIGDRVQRAVALDVHSEAALASVVSPEVDEAVVSVGESIESSILATLYLKRLGVPVVRAKALSDDHATVLRQIGADEVIFPERDTARRIGAHIMNPNLVDFVPIAGEYRVVEMKALSEYDGRTLRELALRARHGVFVIAINRGDPQDIDFLPGPDSRISADDVLVVIGREKDLRKIG